MLRNAGLEVDIAGDGAQAQEMVDSADYDLVLMDMQMPVLDGVTATRRIRARERHRDLPIVAMTGNTSAADRALCLEAGMNEVLTKPMEPARVWEVLPRMIRPRAGLGEGAAAAASEPVPPAAGEAQTEQLFAQLQKVAGLEPELGLRRTGGRPAFYEGMLRQFLETRHTAVAGIRQALQVEDFAVAEREAHTLKGLAGNLGASALQAAMEGVETALRERWPQDGKLEGLLMASESTLASLMEGLATALPTPQPVQGPGDAQPRVAAAVRERA
jgi:two-component system sensor histidine kinase/response regulator